MHFFYDTFLLFPVQNSDLSLLCARGGGQLSLATAMCPWQDSHVCVVSILDG